MKRNKIQSIIRRGLILMLLSLLVPIGVGAQNPTTYDLTVAGVQVTSDNADEINDASGAKLATFDAATNTLTLNNAIISGNIESSLSALTIVVSNDNRLSGSIVSTNTEATLTFQTAGEVAANAHSLYISYEAGTTTQSTISGFKSIALTGMYWDYQQLSQYPPLYKNNALYDISTNDYCSEAKLTSSTVEYPKLWVNGTAVTEQSTEGDGWSYDASYMKLTLSADFGYPIVTNFADQLTVIIDGEINISLDGGAAFVAYQPGASLLFKAGATPTQGSLSLTMSPLAFDGFTKISYEDDLVLNKEEIGYVVSKAPTSTPLLDPVVSDNAKDITMDGDGAGLGADLEGSPNSEVVVNNGILYSLGDADGYYEEGSDKLVLLNTQQTSVPEGNPGTTAFDTAFKGLVTRVPAGEGTITVNAKTDGDGVLNIQIEGRNLKQFSGLTDFTDCEIPYAATKDFFVYIYNSAEAAEIASTSRRAPGRKMANTTSLKSVKVSARSCASAAPSTPTTPVTLTKAMVTEATTDQHVVINNTDVNAIANDAFNGLSDITYIDLTGTSITGLTARSLFPDNTIVLLPTGNDMTAETKNVVVGGICEDLLLTDAQRFDIPSDFTAVKVAQTRTYTAGKNNTICLPYALDATQVAALGTFYKPTDMSEHKVTMTSVEKTDANTPYMYKPKTGVTKFSAEMVDVKKTAGAQVPGSNGFIGTYTAMSINSGSKQYYCFSETGTFLHVTSAVNVLPFRAYFELGAALGRSLDIDFGDGTTGISNVHGEGVKVNGAPVYYDLQGRRVLYPTKGLYILNGKKVIIK